MLDVDLVGFKNLQSLSEALVHIHVVLSDSYDVKIPSSGYAGDESFIRNIFLTDGRNNHGSLIGRSICVSYVQCNSGLFYRLNRLFMKDRGSHEGKFPELCIGNSGNGLGTWNNSGICHENSRYIGPVLINFGSCCNSCKRTCDIASATAHDPDLAAGKASVETGDYQLGMLLKGSLYCLTYLLRVE